MFVTKSKVFYNTSPFHYSYLQEVGKFLYLAREGLLSSSAFFSNIKALSTDSSLSQQLLWELVVGGACGLVGGVCWEEQLLVGQLSL